VRRPRVFYGWYIVGATVAMNLLLSVTYFQGFQAFFLPILHEMGWSRTLLSGAFSLRQVENGLLSPLVGMMVDRLGARKIILGGLLLGCAGMALRSQVQDALLF
jgi:MFS family permease